MLDNLNFKILSPLTVTSAELLSGIPDAENQVYDAGTTYATGDLVWYGGNVWRSLVDSNTGNTPVEGANWTDLGQVDQGADVWSAGTTYAADDYVVYQGSLWKSTVGSNLGNTPNDTDPEWTKQGATNRLKAFDGFLQDAAALTGSIPYLMQFTDLVTDIALLRASGTSVNVVMTDATDGEVYNETFALLDDSAITDWWAYFFEPIIQSDTVLIEEMPPYAGAEIAVTISGGDVSVGQIVAGASLALGTVRTGTSAGIESYSLKDRDAFNRSIVVQRPFSDTVSFDVAIRSQSVGYVKSRLAEREAAPTLYYMSEGAEYGTVAYGFFIDFDILHSTPFVADCVLEIEGLG